MNLLELVQSENINEIAKAIVQVQSSIEHARKDAQNPHFRNDYVSLTSLIDATRENLTNNGLALTQTAVRHEGQDFLLCQLTHADSGQWIRGYFPLSPAKQNDPQAMGSAITYMRRYSLAAMLSVGQEDDDGNAASARESKRASKEAAAPAPAPRPAKVPTTVPAPAGDVPRASAPAPQVPGAPADRAAPEFNREEALSWLANQYNDPATKPMVEPLYVNAAKAAGVTKVTELPDAPLHQLYASVRTLLHA